MKPLNYTIRAGTRANRAELCARGVLGHDSRGPNESRSGRASNVFALRWRAFRAERSGAGVCDVARSLRAVRKWAHHDAVKGLHGRYYAHYALLLSALTPLRHL